MTPIYFCFIIVTILCLEASNLQSLTEKALTQKYLEKLEQSGYNAQIMPESTKGDGNPISIGCSMYILDIFKVDEKNMEFQAKFFFRQSWVDPRLAYPDLNISKVVLNDAKHIWTPDLYFVNEKEGYLHHLITPNVYIKIAKDGTVLFSERLTMTFSCPMDFSKYPHDTQKCYILSETFGYSTKEFDVSWNVTIGISKNITLPFQITNTKDSIKYEYLTTGNYSILEVEIAFQRKIAPFITNLYTPFIFLMILSWISFWIPLKFVAHRLSLLIVVFYLMVDIGNDLNKEAPNTWYTKGSDVWIGVCKSLVIASFLELIAVHMVYANSQKKLCNNNPADGIELYSEDAKVNPVTSKPSSNILQRIANRLKEDVLLSDRIDKTSRILFPILFAAYNFIYWLVYCTVA